MLISKKWLQDFVNLKKTPEEIAAALTRSTVEVEEIKKMGEGLENIVVGKVVSVASHPNADNLRVCRVKDGRGEEQVVCGGSNVKSGMRVAFGRVGARVRRHGQGEPVALVKIKIRGVESAGMICGSDEIGLAEMFPKTEEKEILDLSFLAFGPGTALAEALGLDDVIFHIDNKSMTHRGDLWGHYGIARELAAIFNTKLKAIRPPQIKAGKDVKLTVEVKEKTLCPRYLAVAVGNIKIGPSPDWLRARLLAVGATPINNIVDITNYVMYELGQPLHAFDAAAIMDKKAGRKNIIIRRADAGEKFSALNKETYKLDDDLLVVADDKKVLALAGVIGGEDSKIKDNTTEIIFEAANFDATQVRRASTRLGLRTESSARFEKTLDPERAELALARAVALARELIPSARVISAVADEANYYRAGKNQIKFSPSFLAKKLGVALAKKEIVGVLTKLGFAVSGQGESLTVTVPGWRVEKDISIPEDLVEEVARIYGFNNIPSHLPSLPIASGTPNKLRELERKLKEGLSCEFGFTEVYNYSFVSPELLRRFGEDMSLYLELDNPVASDRPYLRRHLVFGLLQNVEANAHRFEAVKLFETGKVYVAEEKGNKIGPASAEFLPRQNTQLAMVYCKKGETTPFFELSDSIVGALARFGLAAACKKGKIEKSEMVQAGRYAEIYVGETVVGRVGELNPIAQEDFGILNRVAILEMDLNLLAPFLSDKIAYTKLPNYPSVERDLAFFVDKKSAHADILEEIKNADSLVESAELFDVYEAGEVAGGKKSMAYHLVYRSAQKTLEAKLAEAAHSRVIEALKKRFDIEIRG